MALSYTLSRPHRTPQALFSKHPHVFERAPIPQTGSKPGGRCGHGGHKGDTLRPKHTTRPFPRGPPARWPPGLTPPPPASRPIPGPRCTPADPRPPPVLRILNCGCCPCLWNDGHVLVLVAVDSIWLLFCASQRRNVTEREVGGAYGLWRAGDPCARSLATSPHDQDTEQQPDSNDWSGHLEEDLFCEAAR